MIDKSRDMIHKKSLAWRVFLSILVALDELSFLYYGCLFTRENLCGNKDRNFLNVTICSYRNLRSTLLILDFKKTNPSWKRGVENKRFLVAGADLNNSRIWCFIILIYWLWSLAESYLIYQNLAIVIISYLIYRWILAAKWVPIGMTHGSKHHLQRGGKKENNYFFMSSSIINHYLYSRWFEKLISINTSIIPIPSKTRRKSEYYL